MCEWPSTNPGIIVLPFRLTTSVEEPRWRITSSRAPTAGIVPSLTATASADGCASLTVMITPLVYMVSAPVSVEPLDPVLFIIPPADNIPSRNEVVEDRGLRVDNRFIMSEAIID